MTARIATVFLSGVLLVGCETKEPTDIIDACILPAVESVKGTGITAEARCEFARSTTFLALPKTIPSSEELGALGLTDNAVAALAVSKPLGSRWCSLDEHEPADPAAKRGWEARCVGASIEIDHPTIVTARSVIVVVAPSPRGVRLVQVR